MSNLAAPSTKHPDTADNGLDDLGDRLKSRPHAHQTEFRDMPKLTFLDTDFNRKYPPDPYGEEAAENARVWKVYRDERTASDKLMLDGWNQTLDVLLIFAGLFSAVSTAFIVEGYKNLQPDYAEYVADFLYAAAVRSAADNSNTLILPSLEAIHPPRVVEPSSLARWVNGLWFSSLVISLAVALLCTLAKQWLYQYNAHLVRPASSLRDWARRHALYHDGLVSWDVPTFITGLPLLLHLSLFVFFAGLALFVWPLDGVIAYVLIAMSGSLLGFYVIAMFLPLLHVECPSYTPVLVQLMRARIYLTLLKNGALSSLVRKGCLWLGRARSVFGRTGRPYWLSPAVRHPTEAALEQVSHAPRRERAVIAVRAGALDALALRLLLQTSSDPDVVAVGVEAIGAYPPRSATVARLSADGAVRRVVGEYFATFSTGAHDTLSYWRSLRSWLCLESFTTPSFTAYLPMRSSTPFLAPVLAVSSEHLEGRLFECVVPLMNNWMLDPVSEAYVRVRALLDALIVLNVATLSTSGTHGGRPTHLHPSTCSMAIQLLPRSKCVQKMQWRDLLPLMLHLFHAGRLFSLDDASLHYVVDSLTMALDIAAPADRPFLDARAHALHGCLELICYVLNSRALFGLDAKTCEVLAQDVPLVCQTLREAPSRIPAWEGLPHFVAFVSSQQFSETSWTWDALRAIVRFSTIISAARHAWAQSPALCRPMPVFFAVLIRAVAAVDEDVHPTRFNCLEDLVRQLDVAAMRSPVPSFPGDLLRAFLTGPAAISTWPATANARSPKAVEDPLLRLAMLLAAMLHVERNLASELVPVLFTNDFLHARLSGGLHRLHALALDDPSDDLPDLQDDMRGLCRHCAQLAADEWSHICDTVDGQLETDPDGTELRLLLHGLRQVDPAPVCPDDCLCSRLRRPPVERRKWTSRFHIA